MIKQLTRDDLKGMSAEEIRAANDAGQLCAIQGRPIPVDMSDQQSFTIEDLRSGRMTPEQIVEADRQGRIVKDGK